MLKLKVCGMRDKENIASINALNPDLMGFIFYEKSPRYVGKDFRIPFGIKASPVAIVVNKSATEIIQLTEKQNIKMVQLHGEESPELCQELKEKGLSLLKAFAVSDAFNFSTLAAYAPHCDYFLFDTASTQKGGSGVKFNWEILQRYTLGVPFFLSGGITVEDAESIRKINHPGLVGVDINSRFELEPGLKDVKKVKKFIDELNH